MFFNKNNNNNNQQQQTKSKYVHSMHAQKIQYYTMANIQNKIMGIYLPSVLIGNCKIKGAILSDKQ